MPYQKQVLGAREGWRPMAWLPNKEGFLFTGRFHDGSTVDGVVRFYLGMYRITRVDGNEGTLCYGDLEAWKAA